MSAAVSVDSHTLSLPPPLSQLLVVQPLMTLWDLYPDLVQQLVPLLGNDETLQSIGHTLQDRLALAKADV